MEYVYPSNKGAGSFAQNEKNIMNVFMLIGMRVVFNFTLVSSLNLIIVQHNLFFWTSAILSGVSYFDTSPYESQSKLLFGNVKVL